VGPTVGLGPKPWSHVGPSFDAWNRPHGTTLVPPFILGAVPRMVRGPRRRGTTHSPSPRAQRRGTGYGPGHAGTRQGHGGASPLSPARMCARSGSSSAMSCKCSPTAIVTAKPCAYCDRRRAIMGGREKYSPYGYLWLREGDDAHAHRAHARRDARRRAPPVRPARREPPARRGRHTGVRLQDQARPRRWLHLLITVDDEPAHGARDHPSTSRTAIPRGQHAGAGPVLTS